MPIEEIMDRIRIRLVRIYERLQIAAGYSEWAGFTLEHQVSWEKIAEHDRDVSPSTSFEESVKGDSLVLQAQNRLWEDFETRRRGIFYFDWEDREKILKCYKKLYPDRVEEIKRSADELCEHVISIFGKKFYFSRDIPWLRDPVTNLQWPLQYSPWINYRNGTNVGGIKWVWELNRQQHLVTLSKAYFLTQDERYAEEVCKQIRHWIKTNPPLFGVNWSSTLECSVRLISWIWAVHFMQTSKAVTSAFLYEFYGSIYLQTRYIETHLSTYSAANNHLIGEAAALALVAICFPWFRCSESWRAKGIEILTHKITEEIYPDGVFAEQSIHYGKFIIDFYVAILLLLEKHGGKVPKIWRKRLERAGAFLISIKDSHGHVPNIGDNDGGRAVLLCEQPEFNDYESLLNTMSVILDRGDFKKAGKSFDEKSLWLLGLDGFGKYKRMGNVALSTESRAFRQGGYFVLRDKDSVLTFDCGELGDGNHAGHGHADALSITLSVQGKPLLIDPGMPCYNENVPMRNHFRGTVAHNTIAIDGEDQSTIGDVFLWLQRAKARVEKSSFTKEYDYVVGAHNGYNRHGILHSRQVIFVKNSPWLGYWIVTDILKGVGQHFVEQYWHFAPEGEVELRSRGVVVMRTPGVVLIVEPLQRQRLKPEIYMGNKEPFQGWFSPLYGTIVKSPVLCYRGVSRLPLEQTTLLVATDKSEQGLPKIKQFTNEVVKTLTRIDGYENLLEAVSEYGPE